MSLQTRSDENFFWRQKIYYKAIAKQLHELQANSDRKVMVGKVDGAGDRALASRFNIRGFPSFFLIDGWTVREYTGSRSQDALVEFATETYEDYEVSFFMKIQSNIRFHIIHTYTYIDMKD